MRILGIVLVTLGVGYVVSYWILLASTRGGLGIPGVQDPFGNQVAVGAAVAAIGFFILVQFRKVDGKDKQQE